MKEYRKVKLIQSLSCTVRCLNRFSSGNIEIILIAIHLVIIILCIMNIFIIPWKILNHALFALRIVILSFLAISLICVFFNLIFRKIGKLKYGYFYIGFYFSIVCIGFIILDFLFILISLIIIFIKVRKSNEKKNIHNSILSIDIFSLLILIVMFFLWYSEILNILAKLIFDESLKEYIDSKIKFYSSQNAKIVKIEQGRNKGYNYNIDGSQKDNIDLEDIMSTNKINSSDKSNEDIKNNNSIKKENNISKGINK